MFAEGLTMWSCFVRIKTQKLLKLKFSSGEIPLSSLLHMFDMYLNNKNKLGT